MDGMTIILFIVLLLGSGFFSSTEIALMSLPSHKIESLIREGKWGAKRVQNIKKNTDRLLIAILVGNNLVNVFIASLATKISIDMARASSVEESLAVGISTGIITFLLLTFGEIIPKSFGSKNAVFLATLSAYPYQIMLTVFYPVIIFFEYFIKIFTGKSKTHNSMTDEELESFIDLGKDAGTIDESAHKKLIGVLELDNLTVEDIMTPRVDIEGIIDTSTVQEAINSFIEHEHSRIPIYDGEIDKIHSFVTSRDLFLLKYKGLQDKKLSEVKLRKIIKVPINQPLDKLLEILQKNKKHLAIVSDEYGGVAGLVTLEDVIEEVFGEIHDETDIVEENIKEITQDIFHIDSKVPIDEVLEELRIDFYHLGLDEKEMSSETLGFLLTQKLERFPIQNEEIIFDIVEKDEQSEGLDKIIVKVLEIENSKIGTVEVKKVVSQ